MPKQFRDVLAMKLLEGEFKEGQTVEVDFRDGGLVFKAVAAPSAVEVET